MCQYGKIKLSTNETLTLYNMDIVINTSSLRWFLHLHSEFSRAAMRNNAIMIISSQM